MQVELLLGIHPKTLEALVLLVPGAGPEPAHSFKQRILSSEMRNVLQRIPNIFVDSSPNPFQYFANFYNLFVTKL